jgi:hypothetical protein
MGWRGAGKRDRASLCDQNKKQIVKLHMGITPFRKNRYGMGKPLLLSLRLCAALLWSGGGGCTPPGPAEKNRLPEAEPTPRKHCKVNVGEKFVCIFQNVSLIAHLFR